MKVTSSRATNPASIKADALVVPVPSPPGGPEGALAAVDAALGGLVSAVIDDGEVTGAAGQVRVLHTRGDIPVARVLLAGVGDEPDRGAWAAAGRAAARAAREVGARRVALLPAADADRGDVRAMAEGLATGAWRLEAFRSKKAEGGKRGRAKGEMEVVVAGGALTPAGTRAVGATAGAVNLARELAETPSNHMTPTILAKRAEQVARGRRTLSIDVLGPRELTTLKAGALLAVARGSAEQPRMIVMRYRPPRAARTTKEVLGLVGKGVTFDTGGISIKPAGGMEEMKMDMAGGAAVIAAMGLIADLEVPAEVVAVVPATENMLGEAAMKPGDVFTAMNGRTIEVTNTDAEGRLILADALTYCARQGATRMVDMATLTGAIVVAIGEVYAGLFGTDPAFTELVREAGDDTGDLCWPMPLHPGYDPLVKSSVADLSNSAKKRQAGAVYAARFLRDFTEGVPWCHVDVAGTAMQGDHASGFGVRLAADVASRVARVK
ncbi:MAG: leucyl aminopeptidase [Actinobacteria bacterium]|nr:leucyl aminopeptidase [Actinomycetota bacterium]MBM3697207.1 leucyl aminopeptidase [Actinomycetota bacterium]